MMITLLILCALAAGYGWFLAIRNFRAFVRLQGHYKSACAVAEENARVALANQDCAATSRHHARNVTICFWLAWALAVALWLRLRRKLA